MTRFGGWSSGVFLTAWVLCLLAAPCGCREKVQEPKVVPLEGKVAKIDTNRNQITLRYYNEKHKREMTDTGEVAEETEILINGALATLADIRVGEHVRGQVRVEGKGEQRKLTALRIVVERPTTEVQPATTGSEPPGDNDQDSTNPNP